MRRGKIALARYFYERLEKGTYQGLRSLSSGRLTISRAELSMLLDGIALEKGMKRKHFSDSIRIGVCANEAPQS